MMTDFEIFRKTFQGDCLSNGTGDGLFVLLSHQGDFHLFFDEKSPLAITRKREKWRGDVRYNNITVVPGKVTLIKRGVKRIMKATSHQYNVMLQDGNEYIIHNDTGLSGETGRIIKNELPQYLPESIPIQHLIP